MTLPVWRSIVSITRRASGRPRRQAQHVQRVADWRQRVAQFVRQRREEFVLLLVGLTQRLQPVAQLVLARPGFHRRLQRAHERHHTHGLIEHGHVAECVQRPHSGR